MAIVRHPFDPSRGNPVGPGIRYECEVCGTVLDSDASHALACKCYNLILDIDAGRISAKDASKVRVLQDLPERDTH
jgi:hypothetical protein